MNSLPPFPSSILNSPILSLPIETLRAELERRTAEANQLRVARESDAIRERCQRLAGFVREAWHVLEPNTLYIHNWHIDAICEHLEAVTRGEITRLLFNVPPGSMKSLLVSVFWPAWEWAMGFRSLSYLSTAYNDEPVKRDVRKCRDLILSNWFRTIFPDIRLVRFGETSFANSDTGSREGYAFGSLTGLRGDRLIIDDPHSTKTADSDKMRAADERQFREGALNRLNDQLRSAIVMIMQRLHTKDLSGIAIALDIGFVQVCLPMEFEVKTRCVTRWFTDPRTAEGELLDPNRMPLEAWEPLKRGLTQYAIAGQYQQRPAPREGGMFKRMWFGFCKAVPAGARRVRYWDLAATEANGQNDPDYTVGLLLAQDPLGFYYVEDVVRFRGSPAQVEMMITMTAASDAERYGRVMIGLPQDPAAAGKAQAQYLVGKLAGYVVKAESESGDKQTRAEPFASQVEVGNVRLVTGQWNEEFLEELELFPNAAHDDQVDAAAGAFNRMLQPGKGKLVF